VIPEIAFAAQRWSRLEWLEWRGSPSTSGTCRRPGESEVLWVGRFVGSETKAI